MTKLNELLRLDLQFFAEDGGDGSEGQSQGGADDGAEKKSEKIEFTAEQQAHIDALVKDRLRRAKEKEDKAVADAKAEAERKELEKANEFKTLYEQERATREQSEARIAEIEAKALAAELHAKKQSLVLAEGYSADNLTDILEFINGNDEEEIKASIERFKKVSPPKPLPVDPSVSGGSRQTPTQKDGSDYGRELFKKVIKK